MNVKELERALDDVAWPADKDALVAHAERQGASGDVVGAMRALPLATYRNAGEVTSSVQLDSQDTPPPGSLGAREREHGESGVASPMRDQER